MAVPTDISNLFSWYKADSLALTNGTAVSTWTDSSGNARSFTQVTTANQPIFTTNAINGMPSLSFNGTTHVMNATGSTADTFTIFVVGTSTTNAVNQYFVHNGLANGYALTIAANVHDLTYRAVANNPGLTYTANTWEIWAGTRATGTNGQGNLYVNGTSQVSTTGTIITPSANFYVGAGDGSSVYLTGQIAEIVFYSRQLTATERAFVHTYLNNKYAIAVSDNNDHRLMLLGTGA